MRVTEASLAFTYLQGMRERGAELERALRQLSDGKRVRLASDDPAAAQAALGLRARLARGEGATRAAHEARFDLATEESVLGEAYDVIVEARAAALASSSPTSDPAADGILADQVVGLREQLLRLANTHQNGRHLFGGTETLGAPFDAAGVYAGNDAETRVPIDEADTLGSTLSGRRVFQDGGDLFAMLADLSAALDSGDAAAVEALVPQLGAALDHLAAVRAELGDRLRRADLAIERLADRALEWTARVAELEDLPLERAVLAVGSANTAATALSAAAAQVLNRSLFDFMV
jgi:flagellar hook-associated protein 3 FlgL